MSLRYEKSLNLMYPLPYDLFVKWGSGAKLAEPVGDAFFHQRGFAQNADKFF